jgi:hypothetical protein
MEDAQKVQLELRHILMADGRQTAGGGLAYYRRDELALTCYRRRKRTSGLIGYFLAAAAITEQQSTAR